MRHPVLEKLEEPRIEFMLLDIITNQNKMPAEQDVLRAFVLYHPPAIRLFPLIKQLI